ncbi:hypothetical protein [Pollutimonas bauzanensis]|uniref:Flagellar protein FlhE n=1 Tax=Pollutimonas bauzanensis TaxID=658167 RepID=A0A1M5XRC5_9BURK|nr:hypothetical protein [Pollutimonas bauzanensis]SHI02371.1 hypothetical protein SAMN04488135_10792 [Pollutimonas bauzanensis]
MQTPRRWAARAGALLALAVCCCAARAGDVSWTQAKVSPAINYKNVAVATAYLPDAAAAPIAPGARITRVHAMRSYGGGSMVQTEVCWDGTSRCIPMTGGSINTHEFNGLDPSRPMYLVHKVPGEGRGPLPAPVFVKGSVVVWYAP